MGCVYIIEKLSYLGDYDGEFYINGYYSWRFEKVRDIRKKKLKIIMEL